MDKYKIFTSESVSEGHPDKICDQISDAVLDAILAEDKNARVACEVMAKTGLIIVSGEITTNTWIDVEELVRKKILDIGYDSSDMGFDGATCAVVNVIGKQSPDIAMGVDESGSHEQGAGDQGMMFGYACDETETLMPAPIYYAHKLTRKQSEVRRKNLDYILPDCKSQVTFHYDEAGRPSHIDAIVLSTQHKKGVDQDKLKKDVIEHIITPSIPAKFLTDKTKFFINPTGRFEIGGPVGDCGLTGRKIIVDTYGGRARHGGGAFSGKDPSKVDRSVAYFGRYVAKNIVASGLATECEIQVSYAIGVAEPVSVCVNTFGSGIFDDDKISAIAIECFDFKPKSIITKLDLLRPIYCATASYGHFGRDDLDLSWEKLDMVDKLKTFIK